MPMLAQHIVALSLAAVCVGFLARQGWRTLSGKKSSLGGCCGKGCGCAAQQQEEKPRTRTHFIPSDMLGRRK
ncbi:MAG TPA: hypothetical protein VMD30_01845 [Tepidisphaeraceae bacterium]|nr:hypothetical protein [Tepidisphaeraceae bacterium]